ncbi:MAG: hypothetical protein Ct9H300mP26_4500 [Acidimicrobiales bacterium]|nr:MAG: hypothetical protein Ct9H300mP26_4500 [Acidimicrobiales bacterium]
MPSWFLQRLRYRERLIINNTFAIVLGQRIRELGLLRAVGATGRQIRSSVLIEALLIGVVASLVGVFAGRGNLLGVSKPYSSSRRWVRPP